MECSRFPANFHFDGVQFLGHDGAIRSDQWRAPGPLLRLAFSIRRFDALRPSLEVQ